MNISIKPYWRLLVQYLKPSWPWVVLLAVLLSGNMGLQLLNPQIMRRFIDTAVLAENLIRPIGALSGFALGLDSALEAS